MALTFIQWLEAEDSLVFTVGICYCAFESGHLLSTYCLCKAQKRTDSDSIPVFMEQWRWWEERGSLALGCYMNCRWDSALLRQMYYGINLRGRRILDRTCGV